MKNLFLFAFLLLTLNGCSYIQLTDVKTSETEAKRILSMGLSHEENLILAKKVSDPDLISGVINRLKKAETEKNMALLEAENISNYSKMIKVLGHDESVSTSYKAPLVDGSSNASILNNQKDSYSYFLSGVKEKNGLISHQLEITIEYISKNYRNYSSISLCDKWRCEEVEKIDLLVLSTTANNCETSNCNYTETISFDLSHSDLTNNVASGLFFRLNSEDDSTRIQISSAYLKAILQAIN